MTCQFATGHFTLAGPGRFGNFPVREKGLFLACFIPERDSSRYNGRTFEPCAVYVFRTMTGTVRAKTQKTS